jgi:hypothetical protein
MIEHFSSIHINLVWIPEVRLKPLSDPSSRIAQPIVCLEHPASYTMYTTLGQILLCMGIYSLVYVVAYPCIVVYGHVSISRNYNSWGGIPISGSICMLMTRYVYMYLLLNLYIYTHTYTYIYIYILYVCMHVYIYIHTLGRLPRMILYLCYDAGCPRQTWGLFVCSTSSHTSVSAPFPWSSRGCSGGWQHELKHFFMIASTGFRDAKPSLTGNQPQFFMFWIFLEFS